VTDARSAFYLTALCSNKRRPDVECDEHLKGHLRAPLARINEAVVPDNTSSYDIAPNFPGTHMSFIAGKC
jgi:hypothetical protein